MELVSNRCVDLHGRIADKRTTGGWKASHFIIGDDFADTYFRLQWTRYALINALFRHAKGQAKAKPHSYTVHLPTLLWAPEESSPVCPPSVLTNLTREMRKIVQMKFSFLNWFFFAINMGAILGITPLVYIQDAAGFGWGFGIHAAAAICSIVILLAGLRYYRFKMPMGSPFTRFLQKTSNRWRICTVTQVEEFKSFIRVLPVWASTIALSVSYAQLSTFFLSQANIMDRTLGTHFKIPAGSVPVFSAITLILVPIYEKFIVPSLRNITGHHRGITSLQRMGVGLFVLIFAMASAALVERKRRDHKSLKMSVFWLLPQFFLMGAAEVFTYVGQLEFFYDETTDGTRSFS
ncbi:Protein NRT1/ PTR FAMILY 8.2 [Glycine soja]